MDDLLIGLDLEGNYRYYTREHRILASVPVFRNGKPVMTDAGRQSYTSVAKIKGLKLQPLDLIGEIQFYEVMQSE